MSGAATTLTEYDRIAHLFRRAGFGATHDEVTAAVGDGIQKTIDRLLSFDTDPSSITYDHVADRLMENLVDFRDFADLQVWWIDKMVRSANPLQEKMTLFWHGHFATGFSKVNQPLLMFQQNQLFRQHALGNFKALTLAVSQNPAMILYLDNQTNRKGHANENYCRELMELFTLGIGNYTEEDVHEGARAFTGWSCQPLTGRFFFRPRVHDDGVKTFLGQTGNWDGGDVVNMVVDNPACARFIATKLFKFFVHDHPTPEDVEPFAQLFTRSGFEIKPVMAAIFRSDQFYSPLAVYGKARSPAEFVVGTLRNTGAEGPMRAAPYAMKSMGQELFNPPNVKGWDGGMTWINTTTLLTRFNFAMQLARMNEANAPLIRDIHQQLDSGVITSPEEAVDYCSMRLMNRNLSAATRNVLLTYLETGPDGDQEPFDINGPGRERAVAVRKIHGLLHMVMLTPEYQLV
ncbi:MAG: DUF1800 domain-containing protein [Armatimonadetes bacterium]|nr:DUF1800 domain-containing protein [Armatimonadota bacterium]MDE2205375.1 DUF1800 domain-containing protein [Armatimonadota bacterium]